MSASIAQRIALGTVQFGQHYGVANRSGQVTEAEAQAIVRAAGAAGLDTLDTAVAYGSENCLGRIGISAWRTITKLPALPPDTADVGEWVERQVDGSMSRLDVTQLDALLLHRSADLLGPNAASYRSALQRLKESGRVRAVGVSIYDPSELQELWPSWRPDLVQAPYNVIDRRLLHSGWLEKLVAAGTRVHARSVFLQGLLLLPASERPPFFARWGHLLDRWSSWCEENGVSMLQAALGFALSQSTLERVVVGVDSAAQLQEIIAAAASSAPPPPSELSSDDRDLLEPSRWKRS